MKCMLFVSVILNILLTSSCLYSAHPTNVGPSQATTSSSVASTTAAEDACKKKEQAFDVEHTRKTNLAHNQKLQASRGLDVEKDRAQLGVPTNIPFDRTTVSSLLQIPGYSGDQLGEGFWGPNQQHLPMPVPHAEPWPGKEAFLKKLRSVEEAIAEHQKEGGTRFVTANYVGSARSRFEPIMVANFEYVDTRYRWMNKPNGTIRTLRWPAGYSTYYIDRFNVVPSMQFYLYIMNLPLPLPNN